MRSTDSSFRTATLSVFPDPRHLNCSLVTGTFSTGWTCAVLLSRTTGREIDRSCDLNRRQARDLYHRPDLDRALARHRNPCRDADRVVEIPGIDKVVAPQLLARLRERAVGHKPFALAHLYAGGRRRGMQRVGGQVLPARVKVLRKLSGFLVTLLPLGFAQGLLVKVDQQHVFHVCSSIH